MRVVVLAVLATLMLVGCGNGAGEELTVTEYAAWCGRLQMGPENEPETWADLEQWVEEIVDEHESVSPPEDLTDYHGSSTNLAREMLKVAKGQDGGEPIDFEVLLGAVGEASSSYERALENLPSAVRDELAASDCF